MSRKIVITSGKGGVGKTSVVANLGVRLAQVGKRVCMVDADFGLNNLDMMLGLEGLVTYDVSDCIEGRCRPKQALVQSRITRNAYVLPSVHSLSGYEISTDRLNELIDGLATSFDYVLVDCPAGLGGGFTRAVSACDEAIIVTTPQLFSLRDADKVYASLRGMKTDSVRLVINRVRGDLILDGLMLSPEEIEATLKCPLLGVIPDDDSVLLCNAGEIPPEAPSFSAFKILAGNLLSGKVKIYNYAKEYSGFVGSIKRGLKRTL